MTLLTDLAAWFDDVKAEFILNFIDKNRWRMLLTGLGNTLLIAFLACLIGIVLGVVVAIVRTTWDNAGSSMRKGPARLAFAFFNRLCLIYTTIIRGTPMVIQLLIMYYIIFATSDNGVMVATLAFGINSGAYVSEIFRSGIMSIDKGQMEAGRSLGLNYLKTMWFVIPFERDLRCRLCGRERSDLRGQPHPRRHLFAVHAADRGGDHLSDSGHVPHPHGEQAGKEAASG